MATWAPHRAQNLVGLSHIEVKLAYWAFGLRASFLETAFNQILVRVEIQVVSEQKSYEESRDVYSDERLPEFCGHWRIHSVKVDDDQDD